MLIDSEFPLCLRRLFAEKSCTMDEKNSAQSEHVHEWTFHRNVNEFRNKYSQHE